MINVHRPPHIYLPKEIYFLTARTFQGIKYFKGEKKEVLKKFIARAVEVYKVNVYAWVILENHYHLLISFRCDELNCAGCNEIRPVRNKDEFRSAQFVKPKTPSSNQLANFIKYIHRGSSREINKLDGCPGRKVWYQYFDRCIRCEREFYNYFAYIHCNPLKHGFVGEFDRLADYSFSSYSECQNKLGRGWMREAVSNCLVLEKIN